MSVAISNATKCPEDTFFDPRGTWKGRVSIIVNLLLPLSQTHGYIFNRSLSIIFMSLCCLFEFLQSAFFLAVPV